MGLFSRFIHRKSTPLVDENEVALFDEKYKTIIKCTYDESYMEKVEWLNLNTKGAVDVKILTTSPPPKMFIAFEDDADALIFKIKYQ